MVTSYRLDGVLLHLTFMSLSVNGVRQGGLLSLFLFDLCMGDVSAAAVKRL